MNSDSIANDRLVIEAGRVERQYWRDLWRYRELFYFLAWRDLLVRYKQTAVGVAWSLIRPFLTMIVLTLVFGTISKMPTGGVPYPIFIFCGILPWQFFSTAMSESGNSLVANSNLISKVYFPRLVVPASSVITSLVDFAISAVFLVVLMVWYHFVPSANAWLLPLFVFLAFAASFGVGLWVSALMVKYRDFRFIVPFVVQFGLYLSPVGWPSSKLPHYLRLPFALNPMDGVINGFRWCLLGGQQNFPVTHVNPITGFSWCTLDGQQTMYWPAFAISVACIALLLVTGIWYFRKTERYFADII